MPLWQRIVNPTLHGLTSVLCRVDAAQLDRIPASGPLILVANHINFLEIPVLYTRFGSRPLTVLTKAETWNSLLIRTLFDLSKTIPVRRGEGDTTALRLMLQSLESGCILGLSPEGTRSGSGRLQRAHPGVVLVALRSNAPILPMAYYGGERFKENIVRLRRTDFHVVVGQPFRLQAEGVKVTHEVRQQMVDEIMYQIAALLPPYYRGYYSNLNAATEKFLQFPASSQSNLRRARE